jgi:hypothetical protein
VTRERIASRVTNLYARCTRKCHISLWQVASCVYAHRKCTLDPNSTCAISNFKGFQNTYNIYSMALRTVISYNMDRLQTSKRKLKHPDPSVASPYINDQPIHDQYGGIYAWVLSPYLHTHTHTQMHFSQQVFNQILSGNAIPYGTWGSAWEVCEFTHFKMQWKWNAWLHTPQTARSNYQFFLIFF